jgi:Mannosylglycerate hydrolase MGH1-like glycoside hydrolase domain
VTLPEEDEWLAGNVPAFSCPDPLLSGVYEFRWRVFYRHLNHSDAGWTISEFLQPGPGRAFGTVNAAAGHHIHDGRWLRDPRYIDDYIRFWYTDPRAEPHRYTEWIADAVWRRALLTGDFTLPVAVLPGMVDNYEAWEKDSLHPSGLFWAHDLADAMEFSISGDGLRPSINSYQYGNARAIERIALVAGDALTADRFSRRAGRLRRRVLDVLWDGGFFKTRSMSAPGEANYLATASAERRLPERERQNPIPPWGTPGRGRNVKEPIGYLPWYFGLPQGEVDPGPALADLTDPGGFGGTYGLRTAERRHERYRFPVNTTDPRFLCKWNGVSWPFATSQTLTALARLLHGDEAPREAWSPTFYSLLLQYAAAHLQRGDHASGSYQLDEDLDPETGEWVTREWRRRNDPDRLDVGPDYYHSSFVDIVLSGLLGIDVDERGTLTVDPLIPAGMWHWFRVQSLALRGRTVDVVWDQPGLRIVVDGKTAAMRGELGMLTAQL